MQTIVYQCDTAMPAQKLPNCCMQFEDEFVFTYIDGLLKGELNP